MVSHLSKNRDTIEPGDKVVLWTILNDKSHRYEAEELAKEITESMKGRGAEVVALFIDCPDDDNQDRSARSLVSYVNEHDAHIILFSLDEETVLFFPHGECRKGYL
jgi:hypothetical protein